MRPIDEIAAARMAPVHMAPLCLVQVVLVKEMMPTAIKDGPVRIVVPLSRRVKVINGPARVGFRFRNFLLNGLHGVRRAHRAEIIPTEAVCRKTHRVHRGKSMLSFGPLHSGTAGLPNHQFEIQQNVAGGQGRVRDPVKHS